MTPRQVPLAELSDEELIAELERLAANERHATVALIRALMECEARRLYLGQGYSSLFTYCTQRLHLSEGAAYNRIEAARASQRFPPLLDALEGGALSLTTLRLLAPHVTVENWSAVLPLARFKSKAEVERLVASLSPKPAVATSIRKAPASREMIQARPSNAAAAALDLLPASHPQTPPGRPAVTALAPERYKVQVTISAETHAVLERVKALIRHAVPAGDLAEILHRALTLLLTDLERRRCAETTSPRPSSREGHSRHIPAAVKRAVWRRDAGQCAFVGREGRCSERSFLEFHHVRPYAVGGVASVSNIQLRCRAHNAFEASLFFGTDGVE